MSDADSTGRRKSRKRRKPASEHYRFDGPFVGRRTVMQESWPYRVLSHAGHRALSRIEVELGNQGLDENGKLAVTYNDFEEYGIDRKAIRPAIYELVALGFIEIMERGYVAPGDVHVPSRYRITYRPTKSDRATDEWARLETKEEAKEAAKAGREYDPKNEKSSGEIPTFKHFFPVGDSPPIPVGDSPTTGRVANPPLPSRSTLCPLPAGVKLASAAGMPDRVVASPSANGCSPTPTTEVIDHDQRDDYAAADRR